MPDRLAILITGGEGQLGSELRGLVWPDDIDLHLPSSSALDISSRDSVTQAFETHRYDCVINAAAYTAVDRAEIETARAFAVNALGPALLAEASRLSDAPMIQVSTDYVFDGSHADAYSENHPTAPLGAYGASKLAGELATRAGNSRSVILRTAWVFSRHRTNFLKTMLRIAQTHPRLRVVDDQIGCPTSARDIAEALQTIALGMIRNSDAPTGVFHFVNAGSGSWADFAREILSRHYEDDAAADRIDGIPACDYPTPAKRPANSRLDTARITEAYDIRPRHWRLAVAEVVADLRMRKDQS